MSLFERASDEIVSLHRFFVDWFDAATADGADFGRFIRLGTGDGHELGERPNADRIGRALYDAVVRHHRA